jgi:hypothetical protein
LIINFNNSLGIREFFNDFAISEVEHVNTAPAFTATFKTPLPGRPFEGPAV